MLNPQLNKNGELQHLLTIEGLPKAIITNILDTASSFVSIGDREVKKVPLMRGKSVFNLFFENSTRHPHYVRNRLQAFVGRRHQPEYFSFQRQQGRVPARYHRQSGGDACRHVCGAPCINRVRRPDCQAFDRHAPVARTRGECR